MGYHIYELITDNLTIMPVRHFDGEGNEDNNIIIFMNFQDVKTEIDYFTVDFDTKLSFLENQIQEKIDHLEISLYEMIDEALKRYDECNEQINNDTIEGDVFFEDFEFDNIESFDNVSEEELDKIKESIDGNAVGYLNRDTKGGWQNA